MGRISDIASKITSTGKHVTEDFAKSDAEQDKESVAVTDILRALEQLRPEVAVISNGAANWIVRAEEAMADAQTILNGHKPDAWEVIRRAMAASRFVDRSAALLAESDDAELVKKLAELSAAIVSLSDCPIPKPMCRGEEE